MSVMKYLKEIYMKNKCQSASVFLLLLCFFNFEDFLYLLFHLKRILKYRRDIAEEFRSEKLQSLVAV